MTIQSYLASSIRTCSSLSTLRTFLLPTARSGLEFALVQYSRTWSPLSQNAFSMACSMFDSAKSFLDYSTKGLETIGMFWSTALLVQGLLLQLQVNSSCY